MKEDGNNEAIPLVWEIFIGIRLPTKSTEVVQLAFILRLQGVCRGIGTRPDAVKVR